MAIAVLQLISCGNSWEWKHLIQSDHRVCFGPFFHTRQLNHNGLELQTRPGVGGVEPGTKLITVLESGVWTLFPRLHTTPQ